MSEVKVGRYRSFQEGRIKATQAAGEVVVYAGTVGTTSRTQTIVNRFGVVVKQGQLSRNLRPAESDRSV